MVSVVEPTKPVPVPIRSAAAPIRIWQSPAEFIPHSKTSASLHSMSKPRVGPDGSLYYLNRNAWVRDAKFRPKTGSVHRINYTVNSKELLASDVTPGPLPAEAVWK